MDSPAKLATEGTQDEKSHKKHYSIIFVGSQYMQANTHNINKT